MLPFLFARSLSIVIPPSTGKTKFNPLPLSDLDNAINNTKFRVALAAKPRDSQLIFRFFGAQTLFPEACFDPFAPIDLKPILSNPPVRALWPSLNPIISLHICYQNADLQDASPTLVCHLLERRTSAF